MFCLNLHRDLDPDPRVLEADDLHVVGHVLPVRMAIALAFFKRIFTRSLPMNQAHGPIIEVTEPVAPARTRRSGARTLASGYKSCAGTIERVFDSLESFENRPFREKLGTFAPHVVAATRSSR
jgi:hypothetical protein